MSFHIRKKNNQRMKITGHIPCALAKIVDGLMLEWKNLQVIDKVDGKKQGSTKENKSAWSGN